MSGFRSLPKMVVVTCLMMLLYTLGSLTTGINTPSLTFYARSLGASLSTVGLLFSFSNIFTAMVRIPTGILADKYGSKKLIILAFSSSLAALLIALLSRSWQILAVPMMLAGMSSGVMWSTQKYHITKSTSTSNRSAAFSLLFMASFASGFFGPTISGFLADNYGFLMPITCGLVPIAIGLFLALRVLKTRKTENSETSNPSVGLLAPLRQVGKNFWFLCSFKTTFNATGAVTGFLIPIYLKDFFHLSHIEIGMILTATSVLSVLSITAAGKAGTIEGRKRILLLSFLVIPLLFGLGYASNLALFILILCIQRIVRSLITPTQDALIADSTNVRRAGLSFGVVDTSMRLGLAVGTSIGGFIAETFGITTTFYAAGLITLIPSCLALVVKKTIHINPSTDGIGN